MFAQRLLLQELVRRLDFGGKVNIFQVYERYDGANKMQIEQH